MPPRPMPAQQINCNQAAAFRARASVLHAF